MNLNRVDTERFLRILQAAAAKMRNDSTYTGEDFVLCERLIKDTTRTIELDRQIKISTTWSDAK